MSTPQASFSKVTSIAQERERGGGERHVVSLFLVAIAVAAAFVVLVAAGLVDRARLGVFSSLFDTLVGGAGGGVSQRLAAGAIAAVVGFTALALLIRRAAAPVARTSSQRHILSADEHGWVAIDGRGIANVAAAAAKRTPGMLDVSVRAVGSGGAPVRLDMTVSVSAAAEIKRVSEEAKKRANDAVSQLVGIDVQEIAVRVDVIPLEQLDRMLE